jgi:hypothetical protein
MSWVHHRTYVLLYKSDLFLAASAIRKQSCELYTEVPRDKMAGGAIWTCLASSRHTMIQTYMAGVGATFCEGQLAPLQEVMSDYLRSAGC